MRHFAVWGDYIVTANADGTIPVHALIVARVDASRAAAQELVDQANAAIELHDALDRAKAD